MKFFLPSMKKEPRGRYWPEGAAFLTCSGRIQYASAALSSFFHALLKLTVAGLTSLPSLQIVGLSCLLLSLCFLFPLVVLCLLLLLSLLSTQRKETREDLHGIQQPPVECIC